MKTINDCCLRCLLILITVTFCAVVLPCSACDETVCGSIVSKCMLTQSCKCDDPIGNVTCARDCFLCLDHLFSDCCTCLEMCPKANTTDTQLSTKSHVENIQEPSPDLFDILTEENDPFFRWTVFTIPVHLTLLSSAPGGPESGSESHTPGKVVKVSVATNPTSSRSPDDPSDPPLHREDIYQNCTVSYMAQCMSWVKCKAACRSMGASSYRWFHDGCCECVGQNCINYGINESRCLECPDPEDDEDVDEEAESNPNTADSSLDLNDKTTGGLEEADTDQDKKAT